MQLTYDNCVHVLEEAHIESVKAELHEAEADISNIIENVNSVFLDLFANIKPRRLAIREFTKIFITEGEMNKIISRMELYW